MKKIIIAIIALVGALCLFLFISRQPSVDSELIEGSSQVASEEEGTKVASSRFQELYSSDRGQAPLKPFDQQNANLRNDPTIWSEAAMNLAASGLSEEDYIESVKEILDSYQMIVKEGAPVGLNIEITNSLLGGNSKRLAVMDKAHPRITPKGELVDQWGTPYHFHGVSSAEIEVRSAGKDLVLYSDDDIVK